MWNFKLKQRRRSLAVTLTLSKLPVIQRNKKNRTNRTKVSKASEYFCGFVGLLHHNMSDWMCDCGLTSRVEEWVYAAADRVQSAWQPEVKVQKYQPSEVSLFVSHIHPRDRSRVLGISCWALSYSRVIPGMPGRGNRLAGMLLSCRLLDSIGCPVCGAEYQVSMDPRAETRSNSSACRNTFDIPSSQQNHKGIGTPNTTLLVWLTDVKGVMNTRLGN